MGELKKIQNLVRNLALPPFGRSGSASGCLHWRRLVNNIGWENQNIGGQKVVKVINAWAFLDYWGKRSRLPPKYTPMDV